METLFRSFGAILILLLIVLGCDQQIAEKKVLNSTQLTAIVSSQTIYSKYITGIYNNLIVANSLSVDQKNEFAKLVLAANTSFTIENGTVLNSYAAKLGFDVQINNYLHEIRSALSIYNYKEADLIECLNKGLTQYAYSKNQNAAMRTSQFPVDQIVGCTATCEAQTDRTYPNPQGSEEWAVRNGYFSGCFWCCLSSCKPTAP